MQFRGAVRKLKRKPMKIRLKIVLIVLPLMVASLLLVGFAASLSARNGITAVATEFLRFKAEELVNYAQTQWTLLEQNNLSTQEEFVAASKSSVASFARSLIRSKTELILALDEAGRVVMQTDEITLQEQERERLLKLIAENELGWRQLDLGGEPRVVQLEAFSPFGWTFLVSEQEDTFYKAVTDIYMRSGMILAATLLLTLILLLIFINAITRPLGSVVARMKKIIMTNDLSQKVNILYKDEIGDLGHTFNLMTGELDRAYAQIKSYAFQAVIAQKREQKIRNIFQKYVPKDVIDQFFANPESMLVGDTRTLTVLFSDIRRFTSISEKMPPDQIVESLNAYFSRMVDIITTRRGIVDKYIGDAIMAFYGAPVAHRDDVYQAVMSSLEMVAALKEFNARQAEKGLPAFRTGIGLNYGAVTVGNIGSEKKMDYTVIGDMVNLASRLEGLTKYYPAAIIISESVQRKVKDKIPCRQLDRVAVKGKKQGVRIYAPQARLTEAEKKGWKIYHSGLTLYYQRRFSEAARYFRETMKLLPGDKTAAMFLERCSELTRTTPPADWTGVVALDEK
jgi:adenylate cyclase